MAGNALNVYGKFSILVSVLVALSVCLVFTSIGSAIITSPEYPNRTMGIVDSVSCTGNVCSGTVLVNGTPVFIDTLAQGATKGSQMEIFYTNDPLPKYTASAPAQKMFGVSMISSGILILIVALAIGYYSSKSRTASQVVGGVTLVDQISRLFS